MGNFKELKVWQKARELSIRVYKETNSGDISKDFGLKDQIRRSAISIASNIAEGDESGSNKMSIRHFNIAKGSAAELYTQLLIAGDIGYLEQTTLSELIIICESISAMLHKLIQIRKSKT